MPSLYNHDKVIFSYDLPIQFLRALGCKTNVSGSMRDPLTDLLVRAFQ